MSDLNISKDELEAIVQRATAAGAREVLKTLGVPQDDKELSAFRQDIHEVRGLLEAWRSAKRTVFKTVVIWATGIILGAIALGVGIGITGLKLH